MFPILCALLVLQVIAAILSLAQGIAWRRIVRRSLASPAPSAFPRVALICPCKGIEAGLEENLAALARFEYPCYEIFFVTASSQDDAAPLIARLASLPSTTARAIHHLIAGRPLDRGEKVNNLCAAVDKVSQDFSVLAFVDSDALLDSAWLAKMISCLERNPSGAVTSFRWLFSQAGLAGALASAWNASILTMLGDHSKNFCWGGATVISRSAFDEIGASDAWRGALSDDFALTHALRRAHRRIDFAPQCLAPARADFSFRSLAEFTNRQMIITRVYEPRLWLLGALSHLLFVLALLGAAAALFLSSLGVAPRTALAGLALLVILLAAAKAFIRSEAAREALPSWRRQFPRPASCLLAPLVPFLYLLNFAVSAVSRHITWRGVRYLLVSPQVTRVLN